MIVLFHLLDGICTHCTIYMYILIISVRLLWYYLLELLLIFRFKKMSKITNTYFYFKCFSSHQISFESFHAHEFHTGSVFILVSFSFLYCSTGESESFLTQLLINQNAVENIMKCVVNIQWCTPTNTIWSMDARCAGYHQRQLEQYFPEAKWIILLICGELSIAIDKK